MNFPCLISIASRLRNTVPASSVNILRSHGGYYKRLSFNFQTSLDTKIVVPYTNLMDIIQSIILGFVEGITEFLPISSTGHLILASNLLRIEQTNFVKTFEIAIQSGAILSVIALFWNKILKDFGLLKRVLVAFIPTAVIGLLLYKVIKQYLLGSPDVVLISLLVGGVALIGVELMLARRTSHVGVRNNEKRNAKSEELKAFSYEKAFIIGLFQSIAIIPGVSRSASTIVGGMLLGLNRTTATEFSFLLAVPTMLAATALDLKETNFSFSSNEWTILAVGFITSFIVALASIKWLLKYVKSNNFIPFGIYRITLALLYFLLILK